MAGGGTTRDRETRGHEAAGRQAFGASRHSFRPEVQALRALAVALVVVFHLWPGALPGGFVGVDVFFVISGFLITGQLLREAGRLGRIRLGGFWARRVRRLLPAALASLAATGIATWLVAPQTVWRQYFSDIAASAAYVQNWHLVAQAVDYFAPSGASPVQNFWSLAVEEQFYLVWPLLLVVALVATRRRPGARRRAFVAVLGAASVASLIYCVVVSRDAAQIAYLSTLARGWEFGLGGLLALVLPRLSRLGERAASRNGWAAALSGARAALSWCGVAVIVVSAFLLNSGTAFPGAVALWPTLATCVVIAAGVPRGRWAPGRAMTLPAVQWLGGASYSLYLWHWPVIVLAPFAWERIAGRSAPAWSSLLVLALSLALAWASKRWIEDRTRTAAFWSGPKPTRSFAVMAAGMMVVGGLALACAGTVQTTIDVSLDRAANVVRV
ncbi:MAG TPA: acyltransferase, partial [Microbacteriaceae bacterium]|nr:acyltransferase [Microbacteriaceae bacterium]